MIYRYQLVTLLQPSAVSRKVRRPNWLTYLWGIIAPVLIISGYYLADQTLVLMPSLERRYGFGIDLVYLLTILLLEIFGTLAFFSGLYANLATVRTALETALLSWDTFVKRYEFEFSF